MPTETVYIADGAERAVIPTGEVTAYIPDGTETAVIGLPGGGLTIGDLTIYTIADLTWTIGQMNDLF